MEIRKPLQKPYSRYLVSNKGRFRYQEHEPRKIELDTFGRPVATIRDLTQNGKNIKISINRAVYCTFNNLDIDADIDIYHFDGNKKNNDIDNLRVGNFSDIAYNKQSHGKLKIPVYCKFNYKEAEKIRKQYKKRIHRYDKTISYGTLANQYGVNFKTIMNIVNRASHGIDYEKDKNFIYVRR